MADADIRNRRLRMAMIGGGSATSIGDVHRKAARLHDRIELVSGAFSSDPEKSRRQGRELYLDPARVHGSWRELLDAEASLPADRRADFISIVTPNHLHLEPALAALAAGFHVVLDKPMTLNVAEARTLREAALQTGRIVAVTYTNTGYAMIKLARDLVKAGRLGNLRKITVVYPQGWLHERVEDDPGNSGAVWRTDPAKAGSGCLGDIGTHAANLAETVSGLKILEVSAEVSSLVEGRRTEDDAAILMRWEKGAKGIIHASQVLVGEENDLAISVHGDLASLEWRHSDNPHLKIRYPDRPMEVWTRGRPYVAAASPAAARDSRTRPCHPEGPVEAFANIYMNVASAIAELESGTPREQIDMDFPGVDDGLRGMLFVEAALASARAGGRWTELGT